MSRTSSPRIDRRRRARHLPDDDDSCGWLTTLPPAAPARRLAETVRVDCAVLGAGFVGLAAARRMAEARPDWRVAVIDAQRAGEGASGRSSGFVVDLAYFILAKPKAESDRLIRLSRAGIRSLRTLTEAHDIACDWDDRGWLHVAAGDAGLRDLQQLGRWLEARDEPFEWLATEGMERVSGSRFYRGGIRLPGSVLVQSGALVRGLASSLPENVQLFEQSPVSSVETGSTCRLITEGGVLEAPRLVVGLNGYSANLGFLKRRVFPLLTFGSLTRPLEEDERAALGGETTWGLLAQDPMGSSVRRTAEQRLLIRNHLAYAPRLRDDRAFERARRLHRQAFDARFPQLAHVDFEDTWTGVMGTSANRVPFFGHLAPNVVAAGGFTGAGIALGTTYGELLADLLLDRASALLDDARALAGPRWIPPEPFLSTGIRVQVARMNRRAGATL